MKKGNNIACMVPVIGLVLFIALGFLGLWVPAFLIAVPVIVFIVCVFVVLVRTKKRIKIRKESLRKCDPYILLEWAEIHKDDKNYFQKDYYSDCYCCYGLLGDFRKSKEYLEMYGNLELGNYERFLYSFRKACRCFKDGESENGEEYISCANECAAKFKAKMYKKFAAECITELRFCIEKDKGNCGNDIEIFYLGKYEKAGDMTAKCAYSEELAEIYFNRGDYEKMKKYCEYTVANGNKLHYVDDVKKLAEKAGIGLNV